MNYQKLCRTLVLVVGIGTLGCKSDSTSSGGTGGGGGDAGSGGDSGNAGAGGSAKGGKGGGTAQGGGSAGSGGGAAGAGGSVGGTGGGAGGTAGGGAGGMGGGGGVVGVDYYAYVSGNTNDMFRFKFDPATGLLTASTMITAPLTISKPTYLSYRPGGKNLYMSNEGAMSDGAGAMSITPGTGAVTEQSTQATNGATPVHSSVTANGKWLLISNYSGSINIFPINAGTGDIGASAFNVATGPSSHSIWSSPDGKFVYVPCRGAGTTGNVVFQYSLNDATGALTALVPPSVTSDDPRHMGFHPTLKVAYLINEKPDNAGVAGNPSNVVVFTISATGQLTEIQKIAMNANEKWGSHVVVTPNGKWLYAGGRDTDTIYGFSIAAADGKLTAAGMFMGAANATDQPRDFTVDPMGTHLLIASETQSRVTVLKINDASGALTQVGNPYPAAAASQGVVVIGVPKQ